MDILSLPMYNLVAYIFLENKSILLFLINFENVDEGIEQQLKLFI